jgi:hypothetical protein
VKRWPFLLVAGIVAALVVALLGFSLVKQAEGPDDDSQPGYISTWMCANPSCGVTYHFSAAQLKQFGMDPFLVPVGCPECRQKTLTRAERCTSCGELVPSPAPDKLLEAKCPACGKPMFGPLGGIYPEEPRWGERVQVVDGER